MIIVVAPLFLPHVGLRLQPQINELLIAASAASFFAAKKKGGGPHPGPDKEKIVRGKDSESLRPDEHPSECPQSNKCFDGFKLQRSDGSTPWLSCPVHAQRLNENLHRPLL